MPQASGPTSYVYEGFWFNWDKDQTHGLTLTLSAPHANLLTNVLALFVTMSGGQLWTIIRFSLHQIRASPKSPSLSMLHNLQQIVLRNATTDIGAARLLFPLAWASRNNAEKPFKRSVSMAFLAVVHFIFFVIAGTFSASWVTTGQTVLSRSPYCGVWDQSYFEIAGMGINPSTSSTFNLSRQYINNKEDDVQLSLEYAQDCYTSQTSGSMSSNCNTFQQPRLNWTTSYDAACPFEAKACSTNSTTILFDTGLIDTDKDLGINANAPDRLSYRRVTKCTVLNDTMYTTDWVNVTNSTEEQLPWKITYANYGPSTLYSTNETYSYSNFADYFTPFTPVTINPYQINTQLAYGNSSDPSISTFTPIRELAQTYADLILIFLSFSGEYYVPIDDPWFSAHRLRLAQQSVKLAKTTYEFDTPIRTLGCTEQHQICTNSGGCTPLLGYDQVQDFFRSHVNLTSNQNATLDRMMRAITASSMFEVVESIAVKSSAPLLALFQTMTESSVLSEPLPNNQWQLELSNWHSVAMAQLQRTLVEWATGQIAVDTAYLNPPPTDGDRWFCENLKIQGTSFQSFSVLALSLILAFGILIILISLTCESLARCIQARLNKGFARMEIWDDHDMLGPQLWRRKFEQQTPSRSSSFSTIQGQKHARISFKEIETESTRSAPDSKRYPDLPSYRESLSAGGFWIDNGLEHRPTGPRSHEFNRMSWTYSILAV